MNIYEKLLAIQSELKAPKNQYNSFGKYNYRSCEDIVEAIKPLAVKHKVALVLADDMVNVGEYNYIKAIATLTDVEKPGGECVSVSAFAREAVEQKGMNDSQITGSTSSYARKYALNGLFAIDDTKDADATNTHGKDTTPPKPTPIINQEQIQELKDIADDHGITADQLNEYCQKAFKKDLEKITVDEYTKVKARVQNHKEAK